MQPMRASLTSEAGVEVATVEGMIETPEGGDPATGQFEVEETPELMQDVMDGKLFDLAVEGEATIRIKIASIAPTDKDGVSLATFTATP